jgi:hypothetical protein
VKHRTCRRVQPVIDLDSATAARLIAELRAPARVQAESDGGPAGG